jgi:hypothetical protein
MNWIEAKELDAPLNKTILMYRRYKENLIQEQISLGYFGRSALGFGELQYRDQHGQSWPGVDCWSEITDTPRD